MRRKITLLVAVIVTICIAQAQNATFGGSLSGGGSTGSDRAIDVVTDASGNIYSANVFILAAGFNGNNFNGAPKGSGASYDNSLLITKMNPAKVTQWSIYSNDGAVNPTSLATTPSGDLIVTGNMRAIVNSAAQTTTANIIDAAGTVTTFTGLGSASTNVQSFVAKFNSNGILVWIRELNSNAAKSFSVLTDALAVDETGAIYLTGNFVSTVIFPGAAQVTLTTANTTKSAFVVKLDGTTGDMIWHLESTGNIISEILPALTYGDDGYIYAAGDFQNNATPTTPTQSITIGGKSFIPSVGADLTLIKIAKNGTVEYIQERPSVYVNAVKNVRVKDVMVKGGKAVVVGSFNGNAGGILFSGGALTCTTTSLNGFIAAFNTTNGEDLWQKAILSPSIVEILGAVVGNDGNLFTFGYHYNKLGSAAAGNVEFGNGIVLTDATNNMGDLHLASFKLTTGETQEVHLVGKGTGVETANSLCAYNDKLYMIGSSNSNPITYENLSTYSTLGNYDFYLIDYTVANPSTAVNGTESNLKPVIAVNNNTKTMLISNADRVTGATIYDLTGRNIYSTSNISSTFTINTNQFNTGIYLIELTDSEGKRFTEKLLIQ